MDRRNPYDLWLHIWDREFDFPKLQSICNLIWLCGDWILPGMEQKFIKTKHTNHNVLKRKVVSELRD